MQVTAMLGVVVFLVLSVALQTQAQGQEGRRDEEGPVQRPRPGNCQAMYGNLTASSDEKEELEKVAKSQTKAEDSSLSKAAVAGFAAGRCLRQPRSTYIYRYLVINGRKVQCRARITLASCLGYCRSYQSVSPYNGYVSKYCACCQATRLQTVTQYVILYCTNCNYYSYRHTSIQPAQCDCRSC